MPDSVSEPGDERNFKPKLRWHRAELVGFLILAALPILAVFGVFGPTLDASTVVQGALQLDVEHPVRMRFHTIEHFRVRVTNAGDTPATDVRAHFSDAYIRNFSDVKFTPDASRAYLVEIDRIEPGETRLVSVQLKAEGYGRHAGEVAIVHREQRLAIPIETLVLP